MNLVKNADGTVSTLSLLVEVNVARKAAGEAVVENSHFVKRVEQEIDDLESEKFSDAKQGCKSQKYYDLTEDQAKQVAMRESKAVRKWVVGELNRLYAKADEAPKSLADMLEEAAALIRQKDQQIRDRALRGVMCTPKLVKKHPARLPVH